MIGISADSPATQRKFADKESLSVKLLSDPDKAVLAQYGMFGEKKLYGKVSMGIIRSTAVISADGKLEKLFRNVKAGGHAAKVLEFIKSNGG